MCPGDRNGDEVGRRDALMHNEKETLQESIAQQRKELLETMQEPLQQLAAHCNRV